MHPQPRERQPPPQAIASRRAASPRPSHGGQKPASPGPLGRPRGPPHRPDHDGDLLTSLAEEGGRSATAQETPSPNSTLSSPLAADKVVTATGRPRGRVRRHAPRTVTPPARRFRPTPLRDRASPPRRRETPVDATTHARRPEPLPLPSRPVRPAPSPPHGSSWPPSIESSADRDPRPIGPRSLDIGQKPAAALVPSPSRRGLHAQQGERRRAPGRAMSSCSPWPGAPRTTYDARRGDGRRPSSHPLHDEDQRPGRSNREERSSGTCSACPGRPSMSPRSAWRIVSADGRRKREGTGKASDEAVLSVLFPALTAHDARWTVEADGLPCPVRVSSVAARSAERRSEILWLRSAVTKLRSDAIFAFAEAEGVLPPFPDPSRPTWLGDLVVWRDALGNAEHPQTPPWHEVTTPVLFSDWNSAPLIDGNGERARYEQGRLVDGERHLACFRNTRGPRSGLRVFAPASDGSGALDLLWEAPITTTPKEQALASASDDATFIQFMWRDGNLRAPDPLRLRPEDEAAFANASTPSPGEVEIPAHAPPPRSPSTEPSGSCLVDAPEPQFSPTRGPTPRSHAPLHPRRREWSWRVTPRGGSLQRPACPPCVSLRRRRDSGSPRTDRILHRRPEDAFVSLSLPREQGLPGRPFPQKPPSRARSSPTTASPDFGSSFPPPPPQALQPSTSEGGRGWPWCTPEEEGGQLDPGGILHRPPRRACARPTTFVSPGNARPGDAASSTPTATFSPGTWRPIVSIETSDLPSSLSSDSPRSFPPRPTAPPRPALSNRPPRRRKDRRSRPVQEDDLHQPPFPRDRHPPDGCRQAAPTRLEFPMTVTPWIRQARILTDSP